MSFKNKEGREPYYCAMGHEGQTQWVGPSAISCPAVVVLASAKNYFLPIHFAVDFIYFLYDAGGSNRGGKAPSGVSSCLSHDLAVEGFLGVMALISTVSLDEGHKNAVRPSQEL